MPESKLDSIGAVRERVRSRRGDPSPDQSLVDHLDGRTIRGRGSSGDRVYAIEARTISPDAVITLSMGENERFGAERMEQHAITNNWGRLYFPISDDGDGMIPIRSFERDVYEHALYSFAVARALIAVTIAKLDANDMSRTGSVQFRLVRCAYKRTWEITEEGVIAYDTFMSDMRAAHNGPPTPRLASEDVE